VLKYDPFQAYAALFSGAFGSLDAFGQTLTAATPLMFTAMSFSIAYRCGVFNMGGEGQFYMGAILGAWVGYAVVGLPPVLHVALILICGAVGGMIVSLVPAILKTKRKVNEVIVYIMMNYVAIYFTNYMVSSEGPMRMGSTLPATPKIPAGSRLQEIIPNSGINIGIVIAVMVAALFYIFLWKTRSGYKIRAVGYNPFAAECGGIKQVRYSIMAMVISGALAGIGGSMEIVSVYGRFYAGFSSGYGWEGIAVGMLGQNHPVGIVLSAILFGALKTGATAMQIEVGANAELVKIIEALVIFFIAGKWSIMMLIQRARKKNELKKAGMAAASL
jgi:simple sugar transport system permease protein